jgi:RHS repeat-associated protein
VLGGAITQSIYYVTNIKGGANTVTVTFNQSAASPDVRVLEYSGLSTSSPLDVVAAASGNSTAASSGSATTSSASELIFGANTVYTSTKTAGTGFTSRIITPDGDIAEDENASTTGSYSATVTLNSSGNWVMQMATFKAATTSGTSVYADVAYAPYGESYAPSGASDLSFTGQNDDTVSNLYDFLFREYHPVQGRWISPDPAGLAAVNPMNPQTWNRYAYVGGSPLTSTDFLGLCADKPCTHEPHFQDVVTCMVGCGGGGEDVKLTPTFSCPHCHAIIGASDAYQRTMTWTVAVASLAIPYLLGATYWLVVLLWIPDMAVLFFLWAYVGKYWFPPKLVRSVVESTSTLGLGPGPGQQ